MKNLVYRFISRAWQIAWTPTQKQTLRRYMQRSLLPLKLAPRYRALVLKPGRFLALLDQELRQVVDADWYSNAYLNGRTDIDAAAHFSKIGINKRYLPNHYIEFSGKDIPIGLWAPKGVAKFLVSADPEKAYLGPKFAPGAYLAANPDLTGMQENPLVHFMRIGRHEWRDPQPKVAEAPGLWLTAFCSRSEMRPTEINVKVNGWITEKNLSSISVTADGFLLGTARLGLPSPKKPAGSTGVDGFTFFEHLDESLILIPGQTSIEVVANLLDGSTRKLATFMSVWGEFEPKSYFFEAPERARSTSKNLAVFTHQLDIGGGQLYLQEILREIPSIEGLKVVVFAYKDGALRAELEQLGFEVRIREMPDVTDGTRYEKYLAGLDRELAELNPRFALANTMGTFAQVDWATRSNVPVMWFVHESYTRADWVRAAFGTEIPTYVFSKLEDALSNADSVVFEAQATLDLVMNGLPRRNAELMLYGVEIPKPEDVAALQKSRHKFTTAKKTFLVVGTFEARKAQGLITRIAMVMKNEGRAKFLMVGAKPGTPFTETIMATIAKHKLEDVIEVHAVIPNWQDLFAQTDYFFLPSDVESMPQSMMIAMANGIPVIGAKVYGVPELVTDGVTGFLHQPNDINDIVATLEEAIDITEAKYKKMSLAAAESIRKSHNRDAYVTKVKNRVLREIK